MANIRSQMKRNRQTVKRTARNKSMRSQLRTGSRRALEAAQSGDAEAAESALRAAKQGLDVAAARGVLHRNTASRRKSRLENRVRQLLSS
jgi:small subunit ribosomal protein S20